MSKFKSVIQVDEDVFIEVKMKPVPKKITDEYFRYAQQFSNIGDDEKDPHKAAGLRAEALINACNFAFDLAKTFISCRVVNSKQEEINHPDITDKIEFLHEYFPEEIADMFRAHSPYYHSVKNRLDLRDIASQEAEKN